MAVEHCPINDGDLAVVRQTATAKNGDTVVASVDGTFAACGSLAASPRLDFGVSPNCESRLRK
jgi:hypothetical protein